MTLNLIIKTIILKYMTKMELIKEFFKKDKFAEYTGIELLEAEDGHAKTRMKINENHLN